MLNNEIKAFARELIENGFAVYVRDSERTVADMFFVKDNRIGYVCVSIEGMSFSTVHKPCHQCGTGFSVYKGAPSLATAESCFIHAPGWASSSDRDAVRKYANWEEYARKDWTPRKQLTLLDCN